MRTSIIWTVAIIASLFATLSGRADVRNPGFEDTPNQDWTTCVPTCCTSPCPSGLNPLVSIVSAGAPQCMVLRLVTPDGTCITNCGASQEDICVPGSGAFMANPVLQLTFRSRGGSTCGGVTASFSGGGASKVGYIPYSAVWIRNSLSVGVLSNPPSGFTNGIVGFSMMQVPGGSVLEIDDVHLCIIDCPTGNCTSLSDACTTVCEGCKGCTSLCKQCPPLGGQPPIFVATCGTCAGGNNQQTCPCSGQLAQSDGGELLDRVLAEWGEAAGPDDEHDLVHDGIIDEQDLVQALSRLAGQDGN